jgi:hypothetical protein
VSVNKKFDGANAVVNFVCSNGNPIPTLSGFGIITSSESDVVPAPNWICSVFEFLKREANLY